MGSIMDVKGFCNEVYDELSGMKRRIIELRDAACSQNATNKTICTYERHLSELADEIDWKLQILSHSCPLDWNASADFEDTVEVGGPGEEEFSSGSVGG